MYECQYLNLYIFLQSALAEMKDQLSLMERFKRDRERGGI